MYKLPVSKSHKLLFFRILCVCIAEHYVSIFQSQKSLLIHPCRDVLEYCWRKTIIYGMGNQSDTCDRGRTCGAYLGHYAWPFFLLPCICRAVSRKQNRATSLLCMVRSQCDISYNLVCDSPPHFAIFCRYVNFPSVHYSQGIGRIHIV